MGEYEKLIDEMREKVSKESGSNEFFLDMFCFNTYIYTDVNEHKTNTSAK